VFDMEGIVGGYVQTSIQNLGCRAEIAALHRGFRSLPTNLLAESLSLSP
jgi:hypothetical protein